MPNLIGAGPHNHDEGSSLSVAQEKLGWCGRILQFVLAMIRHASRLLCLFFMCPGLDYNTLIHHMDEIRLHGVSEPVESRIVSIAQHHVRPIVRGKAGASV